MNHNRNAWPLDLAATAAVAVTAAVLVLVDASGPLPAALGLLLALVLPGYALSQALFPDSRPGFELRLAIAVALDIAVVALAGLVLQLFVDLTAAAFVAVLAPLTLVATAIAWGRRRQPVLPGGGSWPGAVAVVMLAGAVAIASAAVAIATNGEHEQLEAERFSGFWLLPERAPRGATVGVLNEEGGRSTYRVELSSGGDPLMAWRVRLDEGSEWERFVPSSRVPGSGRLIARLYFEGKLHRVAEITLPSGPEPPRA